MEIQIALRLQEQRRKEEIYMEFRQAVQKDLEQLKLMYREMIRNMNENQIQIWDEIYPCDFLEDDIRNSRLYLMSEHGEPVSAFALCEGDGGENHVEWEKCFVKALYLDRFGVRPNYGGRGIGGRMLAKARTTAKALGAEYLRLFVADINKPAAGLYEKHGFTRRKGVYHLVIDEELTLREYGYEIKL